MLKFKSLLLLLLFNYCFGKQFLIETKSHEEEVEIPLESITDTSGADLTPEAKMETKNIEGEPQAILEQDPAIIDQAEGVDEGAEPEAVAEAETGAKKADDYCV